MLFRSEENERLREAEKQRLSEVETLRMNGEELRLKLKEAVDAHDETVRAAKAHEVEHERLVSGLVSEAERVNEIIMGKDVSCLFFRLICDVSCPDPASFRFAGFYPVDQQRSCICVVILLKVLLLENY